ncbi:unnamed protein product [Linum trigynum]|uniref:Gnk2-homologous domain-containing protein n=1 Tax=Linum trigynum TaxID=586398 RepID=A0AAV2CLW6_9ROSI
MNYSSKLAVAAIVVLGMVSSLAYGKFPDMTIMKGPDCTGRSESKFYNHNVARLVNTLVDRTRHGYRDENNDFSFRHSMPNRNPGSPTGGAVCYEDLGKYDCWNCLLTAKNKIRAGCHKPISAELVLQDCSIWFRMIP